MSWVALVHCVGKPAVSEKFHHPRLAGERGQTTQADNSRINYRGETHNATIESSQRVVFFFQNFLRGRRSE